MFSISKLTSCRGEGVVSGSFGAPESGYCVICQFAVSSQRSFGTSTDLRTVLVSEMEVGRECTRCHPVVLRDTVIP